MTNFSEYGLVGAVVGALLYMLGKILAGKDTTIINLTTALVTLTEEMKNVKQIAVSNGVIMNRLDRDCKRLLERVKK